MAGVSNKSGVKPGSKHGPQSPRKTPERDAAIVAAYRQMGSLRRVAKGFKISRQRVSQIVNGAKSSDTR